MPAKFLVTGGHGFIGRHVAAQLAGAGRIVAGIGNGTWNRDDYERYGFTFWNTAEVSLDALVTYAGEPDVIIHCAGSGSVAFSMTQPQHDFGRTVAATAAVLEYVRVHSPRTVVVYPSSAAVYGLAERLPIHEADALHPASPYGVHKLMAEDLCRSYGRHFGVAVAIVRFFSVYGDGLQKQLLWDACMKAKKGDARFFGTGAELRDWLHVDDAARLLAVAAEHAAVDCPVVNGASGVKASVREVLEVVLRAFGNADDLSFSGDPRPGDPVGYHADIEAARAWDWRPTVPWQEGVARYAEWFKGRQR